VPGLPPETSRRIEWTGKVPRVHWSRGDVVYSTALLNQTMLTGSVCVSIERNDMSGHPWRHLSHRDRFLCYGLPIAVFLFMLIGDKPFPDFMPRMTGQELGFAEIAQELCLLCAGIMGIRILSDRRLVVPLWLTVWVVVCMAGAVYSLLEETSYGQHYFNWNTPDYWREINRQEETNLHNINSWFNQKPRTILELGILLGGVVAPLVGRFNPAKISRLPGRIRIALPDPLLLTTALLAILPRMHERIVAAIGVGSDLFMRTSEVQELYFYYFILLYLLFLRRRLRVLYVESKSA